MQHHTGDGMKRILSNFGAMRATSAVTQTAHAFSGKDPLFGHPCYHEKLTRAADKAAGFSLNTTKSEKTDRHEQDSAGISLLAFAPCDALTLEHETTPVRSTQ
jgi:hypothetical protein